MCVFILGIPQESPYLQNPTLDTFDCLCSNKIFDYFEYVADASLPTCTFMDFLLPFLPETFACLRIDTWGGYSFFLVCWFVTSSVRKKT